MERNTSLSKSLFFFLSYVWRSLLHFIFFWQSQPPAAGPALVADSERGGNGNGHAALSAGMRNVRVGFDETLPLLHTRPLDHTAFAPSPSVPAPASAPAAAETQIEADITVLTHKISALNVQMDAALHGRSERVPATATLKLKLRGVLSQVSALLHGAVITHFDRCPQCSLTLQSSMPLRSRPLPSAVPLRASLPRVRRSRAGLPRASSSRSSSHNSSATSSAD